MGLFIIRATSIELIRNEMRKDQGRAKRKRENERKEEEKVDSGYIFYVISRVQRF
jgi:hypothetical protein